MECGECVFCRPERARLVGPYLGCVHSTATVTLMSTAS